MFVVKKSIKTKINTLLIQSRPPVEIQIGIETCFADKFSGDFASLYFIRLPNIIEITKIRDALKY